MFGRSSGILVHGSKGTLCFGRPPAYQIYAEQEPVLAPVNLVGTMPPAAARVPILGSLGGADGAEGAQFAIASLRAVQEENQKAPERNELKAPLGKMIVTRCRLVAPGAARRRTL